jgi:hypothetical protein
VHVNEVKEKTVFMNALKACFAKHKLSFVPFVIFKMQAHSRMMTTPKFQENKILSYEKEIPQCFDVLRSLNILQSPHNARLHSPKEI